MDLLPKTTDPVSVRHMFGYKLGSEKLGQSACSWGVTSDPFADVNAQNASMWDHLELSKESSVSALKMPESPGIYLSYCSLWSFVSSLRAMGKWHSVIYS